MFARAKQDSKRNTLKKGLSADESRRKREETSNEIRKSKREEGLQKRRNLESASMSQEANETPVQFNADSMPSYVQALYGNDLNANLEATIHFRKLLSIERNPPIEQVIKAGVVPRLVQFLVANNSSKLQFEAAWALTNIASGTSEQTQSLITHGAVNIFVSLLSSQDEELREQAVWALGNIAGDSPKCRDHVLQAGMMMPLLQILQGGGKQSMLRNATWALSNLCRGKPQPNFSQVGVALPTLSRLIFADDAEVIVDALWALSYLTDGSDEQIQTVLESQVAPRIVELLGHSSFSVQTPALRVIGNIVTGNDEQTQTILNLRALPYVYQLLHSPRKGLRKEAAWTVSNITAGNKTQTQAIIDANLVPQLISLLANGEFDVKKEAAWALSNATTWKSPSQIAYLVNHGLIKPMCDLLTAKDAKVISVALEALENVLMVGASGKNSNVNLYSNVIEESEGIDRLEELQTHENEEIYKRSLRMLENYFGAEEEDDENVTPAVNNVGSTSTFAFGAPNAFAVPTGGFAF